MIPKNEIQRQVSPWYSHDSDTVKCPSSDTSVGSSDGKSINFHNRLSENNRKV